MLALSSALSAAPAYAASISEPSEHSSLAETLGTLRGPARSTRAGTLAGRSIARRQGGPPRRLHVLGISAGGFAADAIVREVRAAAPPSECHIRQTLLDAFTAAGLAGLIRDAAAYGVASDVFAFGAMAFEVYYYRDTGDNFYDDMNLFLGLEVLREPVTADPQQMPSQPDGCDDATWAIVCECLASDAAKRPTAQACAERLRGGEGRVCTGPVVLSLISGSS